MMDAWRGYLNPVTVLRFGLGAVFLNAGLQKVNDPSRTGATLDQMGTLPSFWPFNALGGEGFTLLLGAVEAVLGVLLVAGLAARYTVPLTGLLLAGFMARLGVFNGMMITDLALAGMTAAVFLAYRGQVGERSGGHGSGSPGSHEGEAADDGAGMADLPALGLLLLRLALGVSLFWLATNPPSFAGPRFPMAPGAAVLAAAWVLMAGMAVRPVALALAVVMIPWLVDGGLGSLNQAKNMGLLAAFVALAVRGAGDWSLDSLLRRFWIGFVSKDDAPPAPGN